MRTAAEQPRPRAGEQCDLRVDVAGEVVLPEDVLARLHLAAGDLVALERSSHSIRLDTHRDLLASVSEDLDDASAWEFVEGFLEQPLTAVLAGGRLPIPEGVLPLRVGDRCVLQIVGRGLVNEIFLFKVGGDA